MPEQTEVERLTKEKAKINADLAAAVELADQRENLLPKLTAKLDGVRKKLTPLAEAENHLMLAIAKIQGGTPTDYRLRKQRAKKTEGA